MNKTHTLAVITGLMLVTLLTSCEAVAGIFNAGVGVGVFIVIAIVGVLVVVIMKSGKK